MQPPSPDLGRIQEPNQGTQPATDFMTNTIVRRSGGTHPIAPSTKQSLPVVSESTNEALRSASQLGMTLYAQGSNDDIVAALDLAASIQQLRDIFDLPEIRARIESLCNTPLGFRTDKDPNVKRWNKKTNSFEYLDPYEYPIIRDAAIEAVLRGLQLAGNQFNIIAGRFYCTKEGFEHLIRKLGSVTEFRPVIGIPQAKAGGALIECSATWLQDKKQQSLSSTIPVKGDDYSSADQYIGKAKRKFYERCYAAMTGNSMPEGDAADLIEVSVVSKNQSAPSEMRTTSDVAPAIAAAAVPVPVLSEQQLNVLQTAIAKQLNPIGQAAFKLDVCGAFNCEELAQIPADQHTTVMGWLGTPGNQERWNRGCLAGDGRQVLTPEQMLKLMPSEPDESAEDESGENEDDLQKQLV